jgi:hypothetical protein
LPDFPQIATDIWKFIQEIMALGLCGQNLDVYMHGLAMAAAGSGNFSPVPIIPRWLFSCQKI